MKLAPHKLQQKCKMKDLHNALCNVQKTGDSKINRGKYRVMKFILIRAARPTDGNAWKWHQKDATHLCLLHDERFALA